MRKELATVVKAIEEKKGTDIVVLDLTRISTFTDYFVICTGSSSRQMQTVADEIQLKLAASGVYPSHVEGYQVADWILLDYIDFVVHIFSERARAYYAIERLWRDAKQVELDELLRQKTARATRRRKQAGK